MSRVRPSLDAVGCALARPSGLLVLSAGLLAGALMDTVGYFGPGALAMATAAAALAMSAALRIRRGHSEAAQAQQLSGARAVLGLLVAIFLVYDFVKLARAPWQRALFVTAALMLAAEFRRRAGGPGGSRRGRRARLALWTACALALAVCELRSRNGSWIDVWVFQQEASAALLRGENPYAITYPNIYGDLSVYGPGVADTRHVFVFPYSPLTILGDLPAFAALGDVRYAFLAALLVAALAMARLAPAEFRVLAAAAVLFHPTSLRIVRGGWTEPVVLAAGLLLALAIRRMVSLGRGGWAPAGAAAALLLGAKQYAPILLAPILPAIPSRGRGAAIALAVALTAAIVAPFAMWGPRGLWNGVVLMQFRQPFRPDALSWPAAFARLGFGPPMALASFAVVAAVLVLTWPRRRAVAPGMACGAVAFLVFVLSAKQAFVNYYWLANGWLLAAFLLQLGDESRAVPSEEHV
ncbi:MAG TPA: hypothetical protein VMK12_30205 [Anaeromyxobacteraceae bacterium]|nr:hypothetical protein [Anaeromyxobacteraceae bacterium]